MIARILRGSSAARNSSCESLLLALFMTVLGVTMAPAGMARAQSGDRVTIGLAGRMGTPGPVELTVAPDPVIIGRAHPEPPTWQLDARARSVAHKFTVSFEAADHGGPFAVTQGETAAEGSISLGPLKEPMELGHHAYVVRLLGQGGEILAAANATVEVLETGSLTRRVLLILGGLGVILLLFNYLDSKPLTRSYEH